MIDQLAIEDEVAAQIEALDPWVAYVAAISRSAGALRV